jgi:hypothetical protein
MGFNSAFKVLKVNGVHGIDSNFHTVHSRPSWIELINKFLQYQQMPMGRYSSVGIATRYGLDCAGIDSRRGRNFPHPSRPVLGPPNLLYIGYLVFPGGKAAGAWR